MTSPCPNHSRAIVTHQTTFARQPKRTYWMSTTLMRLTISRASATVTGRQSANSGQNSGQPNINTNAFCSKTARHMNPVINVKVDQNKSVKLLVKMSIKFFNIKSSQVGGTHSYRLDMYRDFTHSSLPNKRRFG